MEWANSAAPSSDAAINMYQCATQLFQEYCSTHSQRLTARELQWPLLHGHSASPRQLLLLALEGMAAAARRMEGTDVDTAPGNNAFSSQLPTGGEGLANELSVPGTSLASSECILAATSRVLAWSMQAAAAMAPEKGIVIPQVLPRCDAFASNKPHPPR